MSLDIEIIKSTSPYVHVLTPVDSNGDIIPIITSEVSGSELLKKLDELNTSIKEIEISSENISIEAEDLNLNLNELEALVSGSNILLEDIKNNLSSSSSSSFNGQLIQSGSDISDTNPLPIKIITGSVIVENYPLLQTITGSVIISNLITGSSTEEKQDITNGILSMYTGSLSSINKNTNVFYTEDVEEDTSNNTTFVGKQTKEGIWLLQKITESISGTKTTTTMEYASILNNATKITYDSAWIGRATLTYSEIKNLL